jgi:hypothetical protein
MKTQPQSNHLKTFGMALAAGLIAFSTLFMAFSPALAQTGPAAKPTPRAAVATQRAGVASQVNDSLERVYTRENTWLTSQSTHLLTLSHMAGQAKDLIGKAQAKGVDTGTLQTALDQFNSLIAKAQTQHDTAAGILSTHAGFDANGKVTDATAAHQTMQAARQALYAAHQAILQAVVDLRAAIVAFRLGHPKATAYPAPVN